MADETVVVDSTQVSNDRFHHTIKSFVVGVFCEDNGSPSSTRVIMGGLSVVCSAILIKIIWHVVYLTDLALLSAWLGGLPMIMAGLVALITAPYTVNKASASISDIISSFRKQ